MAAKPHTQATRAEDVGNEFLVFTLGEEEYGIDILKVQEIRGYDAATITRIANVPSFIKGVTNLRGIIVPIVDLRIKFNLGSVEYNEQTVVIILNLDRRVVGIVSRRGVGRADAQRGPGASGARVRRHPVHRVP